MKYNFNFKDCLPVFCTFKKNRNAIHEYFNSYNIIKLYEELLDSPNKKIIKDQIIELDYNNWASIHQKNNLIIFRSEEYTDYSGSYSIDLEEFKTFIFEFKEYLKYRKISVEKGDFDNNKYNEDCFNTGRDYFLTVKKYENDIYDL